MAETLTFYLLSVLVLAIGIVGSLFFFKRKKIKFHPLFFFLGMIVSIVYFVLMFVLFFSTFNANSDQYFYGWGYVFCIGLAYVLILGVVRSLIIKATLFAKEYTGQGMSLVYGLGITPALFVGIYLFMMSIVVIFKSIRFGTPVMDAAEGYLVFGDNNIQNPLFYPLSAHLFIMLFLIAFLVMILANGWFYKAISQRNLPYKITVPFAILFAILETALILPLPFVGSITYGGVALIGGISAGCAVLLATLLPKEKMPADYTKQFE